MFIRMVVLKSLHVEHSCQESSSNLSEIKLYSKVNSFVDFSMAGIEVCVYLQCCECLSAEPRLCVDMGLLLNCMVVL